MARYLAGRLAGLVLILFMVCLFTYLIFFTAVAGSGGDDLREDLHAGADRPDPRRPRARPAVPQPSSGTFLAGIFAGRDYGSGANLVHCPAPCLGYSFQTSQSVWEMIVDRLPVSATVAVGAAVLWLLVGIVRRPAQRGQGGHLVGPDRDGPGPGRRRASPTTCSRWRCSTCWWSSCRSCRSPRPWRSPTARCCGSSRI